MQMGQENPAQIDVLTRDGCLPMVFCDAACHVAEAAFAPDTETGSYLLTLRMSGMDDQSVPLAPDAVSIFQSSSRAVVSGVDDEGQVAWARLLPLGGLNSAEGWVITAQDVASLTRALILGETTGDWSLDGSIGMDSCASDPF